MGLYVWNARDHFRKVPPVKYISAFGKKGWDKLTENKTPDPVSNSTKLTFTMPGFGRGGRWGNMVFQYLFIRVLALNNNADVELNQEAEWIPKRMNLYEDMCDIQDVQTRADTSILDGFHIFPDQLSYIPNYMWRAMFVTNVKHQYCLVLDDVDASINKPITLPATSSVEVEGLFIVNPRFYKKQHEGFLLNTLLKPKEEFQNTINAYVNNLGRGKIKIGIHLRRGDFVSGALNQLFQYPVPVKYVLQWLAANLPSLANPVIYVCSDDRDAYKDIEKAGYDVYTTSKLSPKNKMPFDPYELLEWEILRNCDILLTSNSTFSFSAAMLSKTTPKCYQFNLHERKFTSFDPWETEPLQFHTSSPYVWNYVYARFTFVWRMVNKRFAFSRVFKDIKLWTSWKLTRLACLYYVYGFSLKFFGRLFNVFELFQHTKNYSQRDYTSVRKVNV